jgi:hypothetical protein
VTGSESEGVSPLPPSAKYVYHVLENVEDGKLTRGELIEATELPERTVDDALQTLKNRDYVFTSRKSTDLRQVVCRIHEDTDI